MWISSQARALHERIDLYCNEEICTVYLSITQELKYMYNKKKNRTLQVEIQALGLVNLGTGFSRPYARTAASVHGQSQNSGQELVICSSSPR